MGSKLNPYIAFDGNAQEAMEFYHGVLGGELVVNTFGESGIEGEGAEKVMHAQLTTDVGYTLMASDTPPGTVHRPGQNIAISLSGDDANHLRAYWDGLSDGGEVTMPLEQQVWGDEYGSFVDRFGIVWMVNINGT
ncbi:VOC family protein [Glycomyces sp. TRM65418]|uniref:VOC family protein n=1 Tax=Glycomyces sp. TRM65418 TaxID=2867006 RepID=UPI001CE55163|nr:VOC family protein [Glycomyces sp. TRM65418]MCC3763259.1 VOC family protein [Glycomyces sp. TRM65418]QZD57260.1 VOC family protein [Glycomyces sp. TRM65418]